MAIRGGLSYEDEQRLIDGIQNGDAESIAEAQKLSAQLAKRANVRLSALDEKGYKGSAYRRVKYFLQEDFNREKFSESKKLTGEALIDQLQIVDEFLNSDMSLVSTVRAKYEASTVRGLQESGILSEDTTAAKKRELFRFLSSPIFGEIKQQYLGTLGGTGGYLVAAIDAIENGAKVSELTKMYNDYMEKTSGIISAGEVLDEWLDLEE